MYPMKQYLPDFKTKGKNESRMITSAILPIPSPNHVPFELTIIATSSQPIGYRNDEKIGE